MCFRELDISFQMRSNQKVAPHNFSIVLNGQYMMTVFLNHFFVHLNGEGFSHLDYAFTTILH
jgi:hypothetical protein